MNEGTAAFAIVASLSASAVLACGPAAITPSGRATPALRVVDAGAGDAGTDGAAVEGRPSLDAIAQRGAPFAGGMRELVRREVTGAHSTIEIARADARDACVRVAYSANAPVSARIEDDGGAILAERTADADGLLAARGPVCVRRGRAVRVTFDGPSSLEVRFVAWVAP